MTTLNPRTRLARDQAERLAAIRGAERHVQRAAQPHVEWASDVRVQAELTGTEPAGVEARAVRDAGVVRSTQHTIQPGSAGRVETRAERRVQRVAQMVVEHVAPVRRGRVVIPSGRRPANARRRRPVHDVRPELREEPQWIDLRPVPLREPLPVETVPRPDAVGVAAEAIQLARPGGIHGKSQVREREHVLREAITQVMIRLLDGVVLLDDVAVLVHHIGVARGDLIGRLRPRAVRRLPIPVLGEQT